MLLEPNPLLISELFAKDPLHLTREDKSRIVEEYRKNGRLWVASGTRAAPAKAPKTSPKGKVSLEDLEL